MRATRQRIPLPGTPVGRRTFTILVGLSCSLMAAIPGRAAASHIAQLSILEQSVLLQPGASKKDKKKPAAPPKKEAAPIDPALQRDKEKLPPGYRVPPAKLPDIEIKKPLPIITKPDDAKDPAWRKHTLQMKEYGNLLRRGNFRDARAERELLRYGINYQLALLTQTGILFPSDEDREKIKKAHDEGKRIEAPVTIERVRDDILKDLNDTNSFNGGFEIRDAFIDILCEEAPKLLDNNFYVRFSVAEILSSINNRDADPQKGIAEEPGFRAIKALLGLVNDPNQHPLYKIHPVQALAKICRHKNCKTDDRFAIMESLMNQMTAAKTLPEWYGMRVAEALGQLGEPYDRTRQPVVVDALVAVLKDTGYSYRVRVQAAHSLGRINLDGYRKTDEIAVEILRLASDIAQDYEKDKSNPRWKLYFAWLYLAFQAGDAAEKAEQKGLLRQVDSKPTLASSKAVVTEAYQLFKPLAQNVLGGTPEAAIPDQLRKIKTWLDARGKPGVPVAAGAQ